MMIFYFSLFHFFFFIFCAPISFSFSSVQSLSCVQLFVTPWTPGLPVYHQLPEFTQTHVHWVSHAIQPSHPLSSPFPPAFNLSQHQGLFKWVSSLHQVAKVLEFQLQHQSFQWIFRTDFPVFRDCEKHSGRWGNGHFRIGPLLSVSLELVKS